MKTLSQQQQDDLSKAVSQFGLIGRAFGWMEISQLKNTLSKNEKIEAVIYGIHNSSFVIMVATDTRLHFIDKGWFNSRIEDYQYAHIENIEYDTNILAGMVKVMVSQANILLKFVPKRFIYRFVKTVESHMVSRYNFGEINSQMTSEVSELERLSKLHQAGELTDEEFAIEKTKIISSK